MMDSSNRYGVGYQRAVQAVALMAEAEAEKANADHLRMLHQIQNQMYTATNSEEIETEAANQMSKKWAKFAASLWKLSETEISDPAHVVGYVYAPVYFEVRTISEK